MLTNEELNESLKRLGAEAGGEAKIVSLDDTIKFNCKRCGRCCSGRSDIIINPFDVYKIAKHLNITTQKVVEDYCSITVGCNSYLPIVTLKEDERGLCPFLKFFMKEGVFGCSINNHKPGACIMHPIGVVRRYNTETEEPEATEYIQVPSCDIHGTDIEVKIRDYIKPYLDNEECHAVGSELVFEVSKYIDTKKFIKGIIDRNEEELKELPEEVIDIIKNLDKKVFNVLYSSYVSLTITSMFDVDINRNFLEQVDEIKERIRNTCLKFISVFSVLGIDISTDNITKEQAKVITDECKNIMEGFKEFKKEQDKNKGEE